MKNKSYTKIISILIICLMLFSGCTSASAEVLPSAGYPVGNTFTIITLLVNKYGNPMIWQDSNA